MIKIELSNWTLLDKPEAEYYRYVCWGLNRNYMVSLEKDDQYQIDFSRIPSYRISGCESFLGDEELHVKFLFCSKPLLLILKEELPVYIEDDEELLSGLVDEICVEFIKIFENPETHLDDLFPELQDFKFIKEFPKNINKQYYYYYYRVSDPDDRSTVYNAWPYNKPGRNCWEYGYDIYLSFNLLGIKYLLHRRQSENGQEMFWIYRYDGIEVSEDSMKTIEQILSYKAWKSILSKN